jgi:hypothetical protein
MIEREMVMVLAPELFDQGVIAVQHCRAVYASCAVVVPSIVLIRVDLFSSPAHSV